MSTGTKNRTQQTRWRLGVAGLALVALSACGGRSSDPVSSVNPLDQLFTCDHLTAEIAANTLRMEDLRDERVANRLRNLTRVPGAFFGNPLTALALADTSLAIYREIDALERRNDQVAEMRRDKQCDSGGRTLIALPGVTPTPAAPAAPKPGATPAAGEEAVAAVTPAPAAAPAPAARASAEQPVAEPANAEGPPPADAAVAAYAALLQSGAVTERQPLDDALAARTQSAAPRIDAADLPERSASEIAQIAEDIETVQRAKASPPPAGAKQTPIPTTPLPAARPVAE